MRRTLSVMLTATFALAASTARADDAQARAVVEKAVKALGGEAKLAKAKAETFKGKGKFYGMGDGIDYTGEWAVEHPKRLRVKIDVGGGAFTMVRLIDGGKIYMDANGAKSEVDDKDELAEAKESMHHSWVSSLLPLKDKAFTLSMIGEAKVADRPAVGVRVSHKGRRDVNLFFDKEKGVLLKTETGAKGMDTGWQEVRQETFFSDYKDVDGILHPYAMVVNRDGKKYIEMEVTEMKFHEKLDDTHFAKP